MFSSVSALKPSTFNYFPGKINNSGKANWFRQGNFYAKNNHFLGETSRNYHWLNDVDAIKDKFQKTQEGHSYFDMPHFGTSFSFTPPEQKRKIQQKECKLYDSEEETQNHLKESRINASKQQEEKRRIAQPFDQSNQSFFGKILNYLFMGPPKPILETVTITPSEVSRLDVKCEEFREINAATAASIGRRGKMEDMHLAKEFDVMVGGCLRKVILTAIFDGHEGSECSEFAAKNLEEILKAYLKLFNSESLTDSGITNALCLSLIDASHAYNPQNLQGPLYNLNAGCTANVAIQIGDDIWVANCGDSRAIIVDGEGNGYQISEDASLDEPRYINRVLEMGGDIIPVHGKSRVNGRLAVPASLGDHWSNGIISSRPNIIKLDSKEFNNFDNCLLIQCCDGVFDVSTTEDVAARIKKSQQLSIAEKAKDIVESAYACDSGDNLSVLIRSLSQPS